MTLHEQKDDPRLNKTVLELHSFAIVKSKTWHAQGLRIRNLKLRVPLVT